jgi:hypothetical protein
LWRRYISTNSLQYFHVSYRTRDGEREYLEDGVLSAPTIQEAARKAEMAIKVFAVPGWEEFCEYESMVPISIRAYRLLRRHIIYIDSFFDRHNKLRV